MSSQAATGKAPTAGQPLGCTVPANAEHHARASSS